MSFEDQPTQQIPRTPPPPPLPRPLDVTDGSSDAALDDATDVLPLDELFGPPPTPPAETAEARVTKPPVERAPVERAPVEAPRPAHEPAPAEAKQGPSEPGLADRVRRDASAALHGGATRGREWIGRGDNAVIVSTLLVALLLLLTVALL